MALESTDSTGINPDATPAITPDAVINAGREEIARRLFAGQLAAELSVAEYALTSFQPPIVTVSVQGQEFSAPISLQS